MSEYQYYEFVAIDRPLTQAEQKSLRAKSSRAEISPTRFVNVYHYGDFGGDATDVLARYFDAAIYVSNFGLRRVAFRLPETSVDPEALRPYLCDALKLTNKLGHAVLTFEWSSEDAGGWVDDAEASAWLPELLPIRAQLLRGDLGPLYVPWLHQCVTRGVDDEDAETTEPPVPAGLRAPNAALRALVRFFEIDEDLFEAAAEASADDVASEPAPEALTAWLAGLPSGDKDALLARVAAGDGRRVEAELQRRFADGQRAHAVAREAAPRRTLAQIEERARVLAKERKRREAAAAERERAERARAEAAAQTKRLDALASRGAAAWGEVEALVAQQNASGYEQAVALLSDLQALAEREQKSPAFLARVGALLDKHPGKPALRRRLRERGLPSGS